jgi:hypothetical protein
MQMKRSSQLRKITFVNSVSKRRETTGKRAIERVNGRTGAEEKSEMTQQSEMLFDK